MLKKRPSSCRLACQAIIQGPVSVETKPDKKAGLKKAKAEAAARKAATAKADSEESEPTKAAVE